MSPKSTMGLTLPDSTGIGPLERAARAYEDLKGRVTGLEAEVRALRGQVSDLPKLKEDVAEVLLIVKSLKAVFSHVTAKGIGLFIGGVISAAVAAFGAVKATAPAPAPATVVQRSAFDRALDACRSLEGGQAQGECIARVIREQMPAR